MLAHYHGQIWNGSEIAASLGVNPQTARNYLDALEQTFMVRRLVPWYVNVGKRLVKSPKVYLRDSGLLHTLQGIRDMDIALKDLKLKQLYVIYPGERAYALSEQIHALPLSGELPKLY